MKAIIFKRLSMGNKFSFDFYNGVHSLLTSQPFPYAINDVSVNSIHAPMSLLNTLIHYGLSLL